MSCSRAKRSCNQIYFNKIHFQLERFLGCSLKGCSRLRSHMGIRSRLCLGNRGMFRCKFLKFPSCGLSRVLRLKDLLLGQNKLCCIGLICCFFVMEGLCLLDCNKTCRLLMLFRCRGLFGCWFNCLLVLRFNLSNLNN